jgi:hypothetical protein
MHYAQTGQVDTKHLDTDAIALALTSVLSQIHKENPGVVAAYGWQPAELPDTAIVHPSVPPPAQ